MYSYNRLHMNASAILTAQIFIINTNNNEANVFEMKKRILKKKKLSSKITQINQISPYYQQSAEFASTSDHNYWLPKSKIQAREKNLCMFVLTRNKQHKIGVHVLSRCFGTGSTLYWNPSPTTLPNIATGHLRLLIKKKNRYTHNLLKKHFCYHTTYKCTFRVSSVDEN